MFLIVASFGTSTPYEGHAFDLSIKPDPTAPAPTAEKPLRYMKQPEIHHIFKPDPKSPPKIISLFFTAIVLATLPGLFIVVRQVLSGSKMRLTLVATSGWRSERT